MFAVHNAAVICNLDFKVVYPPVRLYNIQKYRRKSEDANNLYCMRLAC